MPIYISKEFGEIQVADYFSARLLDNASFHEKILTAGEELDNSRYARRDGNYSEYGLISYHRYNRTGVFGLRGLEFFFEIQAKKLLERKGDMFPVIMLDLGGMMGQTWSRLALAFEQEVSQSQIAFVVSNLVYKPEKHLPDELRHKNNKEGIRELLEKAEPLVHYINGGASDLKEKIVVLPNKLSIQLNGNVDFLHEAASLAHWSYIPELDILRAVRLLSPFGTYFIRRLVNLAGRPLDYYHLEEGEDLWSGQNRDQAREDGVKIAFQEIQRRFGMKQIEAVEEGELKGRKIIQAFLFRKESSPSIECNYSAM